MLEKAKGDASPIREKGFAEAEAKDKLQESLNKFGDKAIRTLVAEDIVEAERQIGIETAKAIASADIKVFAGGGKAGEDGFNLGQLIESAKMGSVSSSDAMLNRIARPNDMGLSALGLKAIKKENLEESQKDTIPKKG